MPCESDVVSYQRVITSWTQSTDRHRSCGRFYTVINSDLEEGRPTVNAQAALNMM